MKINDEAIEFYAGADHWGIEGAPSRCDSTGAMSQAEDQGGGVLRLVVEVQGHRGV